MSSLHRSEKLSPIVRRCCSSYIYPLRQKTNSYISICRQTPWADPGICVTGSPLPFPLEVVSPLNKLGDLRSAVSSPQRVPGRNELGALWSYEKANGRNHFEYLTKPRINITNVRHSRRSSNEFCSGEYIHKCRSYPSRGEGIARIAVRSSSA